MTGLAKKKKRKEKKIHFKELSTRSNVYNINICHWFIFTLNYYSWMVAIQIKLKKVAL